MALERSEDIAAFIDEKKRKRRVRLAIAAGAALIACAVLGGLVLGAVVSWEDPSALAGPYDGKTNEQVQNDLNESVAWNEMEISVASSMTVLEGQTEVEARIENVAANHLDQRVTIALADAPDDVLYTSGAIHPGEHLQVINLAHPISVGEHTAIVTFQGYEMDGRLGGGGEVWGHDEFGASCSAEVTITCLPAESQGEQVAEVLETTGEADVAPEPDEQGSNAQDASVDGGEEPEGQGEEGSQV